MEVVLTGTVIKIGDTQEFGDDFSKREVVFRVDGDSKYPQDIPVEFVKDKAKLCEDIEEGQKGIIRADLRGSYWEKGDRHFLSLSGWQFSVEDAVAEEPEPSKKKEAAKEDFPF